VAHANMRRHLRLAPTPHGGDQHSLLNLRSHGAKDMLIWANLVGRTGSNRRSRGFQPSVANSDPSEIIRLSQLRPAQQGRGGVGRPRLIRARMECCGPVGQNAGRIATLDVRRLLVSWTTKPGTLCGRTPAAESDLGEPLR